MSIGVGPAVGGRRMAAAGCALTLALLAGCSGAADSAATGSRSTPTQGGGRTQEAPAVPAARVAFRPADGARDISPLASVVVRATDGILRDVQVRNEAGRAVTGRLSANRTTWTSAEPLGYGRAYEVTAAAANSAGTQSRASARFSTVTPVTYTMPYLFPGHRIGRVGIGQPITVHFDEAIGDRVAAERALKVTATPPTQGGWNWFDDQNVHWRPRTYWKPGTKVTVEANVYGVHVGNGIYGQQDVSTSFTVGPSRIATIDDRTHMMTVRISGKVVRRIPVSMGRGGSVTVKGKTIYFTTQSGPHVVQEKYPVKEMSSESYGLPVDDPLGYKEKIPLAVRVSGDGEFVHAASWSVADQGVRNVSHGCINISPDNAKWFYRTFTYGDIVDIKNTGVWLRPGNKYGDWMVPWADWVAGSALH
jgi:lipoprotein-anchoring transpeptidase ErfK/SrfK